MPPTEIVAHRGASFDAPENTLAAIVLAWQQMADAVEIDVRVTKDEQIVAIHDADTRRTCERNLVVSNTTYAQIQQLDASHNAREGKYAGEGVPRLAEILTTIPPHGKLFVEVKCGDEIIGPLTSQFTQDTQQQSRVVLIGFNAPLLAKIKTELPDVAALLCVAAEDEKDTWDHADIEVLIKEAKRLNFDGVDLDARATICPEEVTRLRSENLRCYFWTVDDPVYARTLSDCGVDGITTNRPGWLRTELGRNPPPATGKIL